MLESNLLRSREAAAIVATARWMYNSGLARTESRGMHKRSDYPDTDPNQQRYLISGGLDQVWVKSVEENQAIVEKELVLQ